MLPKPCFIPIHSNPKTLIDDNIPTQLPFYLPAIRAPWPEHTISFLYSLYLLLALIFLSIQSTQTPTWPCSLSAYDLSDKISSRNRVWKARCFDPNGEPRDVFIRLLSIDPTIASREVVEKAAEELRLITHPSVVKVEHFFFDENQLCLVYSEQSSWLTLFEFQLTQDSGFDLHVVAAFTKQLVEFLSDLHRSGRFWYDVRPTQIILNSDGRISFILHSLRSLVRLKTRDSLPFVAPEQLQAKRELSLEELAALQYSGDVWALGITALTLYLCHANYDVSTHAEKMVRLQEGVLVAELFPNLHPTFLMFVEACLQTDVEKRALPEALLQYEFIKSAPGVDYIKDNLVVSFDVFDGRNDIDEGFGPTESALLLPPSSTNSLNNLPNLPLAPTPSYAALSAATFSSMQSLPSPMPSSPSSITSHHGSSHTAPNTPLTLRNLAIVPTANQSNTASATRGVHTPSNGTSFTSVSITSISDVEMLSKLPAVSQPGNIKSNFTQGTPTSVSPSSSTTFGTISSYDPVERPTPVPSPSLDSQSHNVPFETFLGETKTEYIVFIRAIPHTQIRLILESRSLSIKGKLPGLSFPDDEGLVMRDALTVDFDRVVHFPSTVNASSYNKGYNKECSTLTVRIRKFIPVDLGSETF